MKSFTFLYALTCAAAINASIIPVDTKDLARRALVAVAAPDPFADIQSLEKRKGGGGKSGGTSSSGSSSSGSSSSGSSSSGAKTGSTSSSGSTASRGSTTSNTGGRTTTGSGVRPAYGGYYGGGGSVPYRSGLASPLGLASIGLFGIATVALLWPYSWYGSAYYYPWHNPASFYNSSAQQNQTKPVLCICEEDAVCGCDENTNSSYITSIIGDGDFNKLNKSLAYVNDVNGTSTILINGTLPNGTTADGGTDSPDATTSAAVRTVVTNGGTVLLAAVVFSFVWL